MKMEKILANWASKWGNEENLSHNYGEENAQTSLEIFSGRINRLTELESEISRFDNSKSDDVLKSYSAGFLSQ
jgi:hypothetical protein